MILVCHNFDGQLGSLCRQASCSWFSDSLHGWCRNTWTSTLSDPSLSSSYTSFAYSVKWSPFKRFPLTSGVSSSKMPGNFCKMRPSYSPGRPCPAPPLPPWWGYWLVAIQWGWKPVHLALLDQHQTLQKGEPTGQLKYCRRPSVYYHSEYKCMASSSFWPWSHISYPSDTQSAQHQSHRPYSTLKLHLNQSCRLLLVVHLYLWLRATLASCSITVTIWEVLHLKYFLTLVQLCS